MPEKYYKLEMIEWYDAQADCSWAEEQDIDRWMQEDFLAMEIGWVIRETKTMIILTSSVGNDGSIGNRTKIPKPWIKTRRSLSIKGEEDAKINMGRAKRSKTRNSSN